MCAGIPGHNVSPESCLGRCPCISEPCTSSGRRHKHTPKRCGGKGANARPGPLLEGRYASRTAPDGFANVKECTAEPAAAVEGDTHAGASTAGTCRAGAGMAAQATVFAAAETASGLVCLPDLSPPAYGSVYLQEHLPLAWLMHSVAMFPLTGPCVCFKAFLGCPMHSAVSAQVF